MDNIEMVAKEPIVAICYDFDKTLSPKDMQEFGLIPRLNIGIDEFWEEAGVIAKKNGMDKILAYMWLILQKADAAKVKLGEEDFNSLGKDIELFEGVSTWFSRINAFAARNGIKVEHYIISAGLKEIIEGTSIAKYFTGIYASSFAYGAYGNPLWPKQVVNYTTKTQYLFRISKNCLDLSDEDSVNEFVESENRRIPFTNFVYIGDSETDIPAMKIVKQGGGTSIGVFNGRNGNADKVKKLLYENRIDFLMPANYMECSDLEQAVFSALKKIKAVDTLTRLGRKQRKLFNK